MKNSILSDLINESKVDMQSISTATNINYFSLAKYVDGTRSVTRKTAEKLAPYLSVQLGREVKAESLISGKDAEVDTARIPIYDLKNFSPVEYITIVVDDDKEYFYVIADLILLQFFKNTRILCVKQNTAENGDYIVYSCRGIKRLGIVKRSEDHVILYPLTRPDDVITEKLTDIEVLGRCLRLENTL